MAGKVTEVMFSDGKPRVTDVVALHNAGRKVAVDPRNQSWTLILEGEHDEAEIRSIIFHDPDLKVLVRDADYPGLPFRPEF